MQKFSGIAEEASSGSKSFGIPRLSDHLDASHVVETPALTQSESSDCVTPRLKAWVALPTLLWKRRKRSAAAAAAGLAEAAPRPLRPAGSFSAASVERLLGEDARLTGAQRPREVVSSTF